MVTSKTTMSSYLLVFAFCLMAFIFNGDYLAVNLAMNPIIQDFHSNLNVIQWILSGYMLAWALLVIPAGKLLEYYSTRQLSNIGLGLFLLSSIAAGFAVDPWTIIIARAVQGAAAAIFSPTIFAMIFSHFAEDKRGKVMGLIGLSVGVGLALGPMMGGLLISWFGWRSIFFINVPIGILVMAIITAVDKTPISNANTAQKISKSSMLLLSASLISLLLLLGAQQQWSDNPHISHYLGIFSAVTFIVFAYLQKKIKNPLIPLQLFLNKNFVGCCVGIFAIEYAFSSILIVTGLYLQNYLNLSPYESSFIFLWITLVFGLMAVIGGRWTDKAGIRAPVVSGLAILAITAALFPSLSSTGNLQWMSILFLIMGLGIGLPFSALNAGIVKTVAPEQLGIASGVFLMITLIGNAVGVAMSTVIYTYGEQLSGMNLSMNVTVLVCLFCTVFCFKLMRKKDVTENSAAMMSHSG
ncbi:MAG: MFS transporter [Silvanigrellaceae bacterium]|nr:MFS transporter [Silvanigrellaceae bacterium]